MRSPRKNKAFVILVAILALGGHLFSQKAIPDQNQNKLWTDYRLSKDSATSVSSLILLSKEIAKTDKVLAEKLAKRALELSQEISNKELEGKSMSNLCGLYFDVSDYAKSHQIAEQMIKFGEETKQPELVADGYKMIGKHYHFRGDYSKSLQNYLIALNRFENIKDPVQISDVYNCIGGVYLNQAQNKKAYENYHKAMEIQFSLKDPIGIGRGYLNLANVSLIEKDYTKGKFLLDSSLYYYNNVGYVFGKALVYATYSDILLEKKQTDSALTYLLKAHGILQGLNKAYTLTQTGLSLSTIYFNKKDIKTSLKYINEAIEMGEKTRQNHNLAPLYLFKSTILESTGKTADAFKNFKLYKQYSDSAINTNAIRKQAEDALQFDYDKKEHQKEIEKQKMLAVQKEEEARQKLVLKSTILGLILLATILFLVVRSFLNNKKNSKIISLQKEEVEKQHLLLKEKNKEVMDSINYAKRLQNAILPSENTINAHFKNSYVLYKPKDIVAGDFYWMHVSNQSQANSKQAEKLPADDCILIAAADCTGHGVPGAMVSVVCCNALNRTVKEFGITEPNKILDKTRELVIETFEKSDKDVKDGMDISLCSINTKTNELIWSGANNPLWIIRTDEGKLEEITADKQPIGKTDDPKGFKAHKLKLNTNDIVILFTDGYADQFGGPRGKKFKYKQLTELLISISKLPMDEQHLELDKTFSTWKGDLEQVDDVCVIAIKI